MRTSKAPFLLLVLLLVICFSLATSLQRPSGLRAHDSDDVLAAMMGESRRMFANHFFVKADAYFHSGFYPTIFDNQESFKTPHMAEDAGVLKGRNQGEETQFMGKPRDIIEKFTRNFLPSVHTHLDEGGPQGTNNAGSDLGESQGGDVREILPWLQLSAELDPSRIETYMVTAYWLRKKMGKVDEAEAFIRKGLNANPGNPSLLFELGRLYHEDRKEINRPRNIWEMAVDKLDATPEPHTEEQNFMLMQLTLNLARLEESQANLQAALHWLERLEKVSPEPEHVREEINDTKQKIAHSASQSGIHAPGSN
ncbi:MAG TPA: hypothetical protein VG754_11910 [Verrucomicrobiae bacterium]|nr:hypothetical protein [Verrucomicrobiae bacterium]